MHVIISCLAYLKEDKQNLNSCAHQLHSFFFSLSKNVHILMKKTNFLCSWPFLSFLLNPKADSNQQKLKIGFLENYISATKSTSQKGLVCLFLNIVKNDLCEYTEFDSISLKRDILSTTALFKFELKNTLEQMWHKLMWLITPYHIWLTVLLLFSYLQIPLGILYIINITQKITFVWMNGSDLE